MGDVGDLAALLTLHLNEVVQQDLREYAAGSQVIVIGLQSVQSLLQRGGQTLQLLLFLLRQIEQVHIIGTPAVLMGIDLILHTVQARHQDGSVAEVGIAGSIRVPQLKAAHIGGLCVGGNPNDRAAVGGSVAHRYRGLKARHQPLEGIGAGVGNCAKRSNVLQQAAHEVMRGLAQMGIAVVIRENRLTVLQQQHVDMHTVAGLAVNRLGHQSGSLAVFQSGVADNILDHHAGIGHLGHLAQLGLDLKLTGGAHLGVMVLDGNTCLLHQHAHLAAALIGGIEGLSDMVILLLGNHAAHALNGGVPVGLVHIQGHADGIGRNLPAHLIKQVELEFRQDQHGVGNAGFLHIIFRGLDNVPGVLGQGTVLGMVDDHGVAGHGQGGNLAERIHHSGIRIGNKDHVALFHHSIAVIGSVKAYALGHNFLVKIPRGNGHMAELAVDVHHLKVHHFDSLLLNEAHDILYSFCHCSCPPVFNQCGFLK